MLNNIDLWYWDGTQKINEDWNKNYNIIKKYIEKYDKLPNDKIS